MSLGWSGERRAKEMPSGWNWKKPVRAKKVGECQEMNGILVPHKGICWGRGSGSGLMQNHRQLKADLEKAQNLPKVTQLVNNWAEIWTKPVISPRPNTSQDTEKVPLPPLYTAMTPNTILKAPHLQHSSSSTLNTNISEETMIEQFPNQMFVKRGGEEGRKTKAVLGCVINVIRVVVLNRLRLLLMAPHSSTIAWKIPWMEEPGGLQSMGSLGVGHDWATSLSLFIFMHRRRQWQPTPVFLPGESQGWGSLVGCRLWGGTESDMTERLSSSSSSSKKPKTPNLHNIEWGWDLIQCVYVLGSCATCSLLNE